MERSSAHILISVLGQYRNYENVPYKVEGEHNTIESPFVFYPIYEHLKNKGDVHLILLYPESLIAIDNLKSITEYDRLCDSSKKDILKVLDEKGIKNETLRKAIEKSILIILPSTGRYQNVYFDNTTQSMKIFITLKLYDYLKTYILNNYDDVSFHVDISHGHNINTITVVDAIHNLYIAYLLSKMHSDKVEPIYYYVSEVVSKDDKNSVTHITKHIHRRRVFRAKYNPLKDIKECKIFKINTNVNVKEKGSVIKHQKESMKKLERYLTSIEKMQSINFMEYYTLIAPMIINITQMEEELNNDIIKNVIDSYINTYLNNRKVTYKSPNLDVQYQLLFNDKKRILDLIWLDAIIQKYKESLKEIKKNIVSKDNYYIIKSEYIHHIVEHLYNDEVLKAYMKEELNTYGKHVVEKYKEYTEKKDFNQKIIIEEVTFISIPHLRNLNITQKDESSKKIFRDSIAHIGLNALFTYFGIKNIEEKYFLIDTSSTHYKKLLDHIYEEMQK